MAIHILSMRQFIAINNSVGARVSQKTRFMHQLDAIYVRGYVVVAVVVPYLDAL
jgi:hypothetical protein